jgi:cytosine/adenosine deaminase-related metal-dependent hydrolase
VTIVVRDVTVVTMDAGRRIIEGGSITIDGERITAVGTAVDGAAAEVIEGHGMVAIPGLIDTHAHADQSILRGRTDDLHWIPFLRDHIEPYLATRDPDTAVAAYRLAVLEMVKGGTTAFVSPNVDPRDDLAALVEATVPVRPVFARWTESAAALDAAAESVARWDGADGGRVQMWFGLMVPRQPGDGYEPGFYESVVGRGAGVAYHFCSEIEDLQYYVDTFGMRPAEWAERNGALGPNVVLINCCWMDAVEIEILARTGTHVAYSPSATTKMATGITPVVAFLEAGVNVSLGTDGGANNNSHDMIREMKAGALVQNSAARRAGALAAVDVLALATIGGARAIGREADLGSIEVGKRADIVLVDLRKPHTAPVTDPVSSLVYAAHAGDVDTVIIDGRVVMRGRVVEGIDEEAVIAAAERAAARV